MLSVAASGPTASGRKVTPIVQLFPGLSIGEQLWSSPNCEVSPVVTVNVIWLQKYPAG
jgi:hypothetical protein